MRWDQIESKWHAMTRRVRSGEALSVETLRGEAAGPYAGTAEALLSTPASRSQRPSEDLLGTQQ